MGESYLRMLTRTQREVFSIAEKGAFRVREYAWVTVWVRSGGLNDVANGVAPEIDAGDPEPGSDGQSRLFALTL